MKIAFITNRLPWPLNDGGNLATYHLIRELNNKGHETILISLNTRKHRTDPENLGSIADVHTHDVDTGLKPWRMLWGVFQSKPYNVERFNNKEFADLMSRVLTDSKPDVVQLEGSYQALFAPAIRKAVPDAKIVLRSHNIEHVIWDRVAENASNPLARLYLRNLTPKIEKFEKTSLHHFDGIGAITENDEDWYRKNGFSGALTTVNAGVDLAAYDPNPAFAETDNALGFIGSLEWEPNVQGVKWFVENVWPSVLKERPDAKFHLAGKNAPDWMNKWEVEGLIFHGMVSDINEFYAKFNIFIVPLLSGSGMRLKVVEAMAQQKCILSTAVGSEGIRLEDGKDIIFADDPADFSNALVKLLNDPQRVRSIAQAARETATRHYDWQTLTDRFVDFYSSLT